MKIIITCMFYEKNKTIQNNQKDEKSFSWRESNLGPSTCKVNALSIGPQQLMLNKVVKLIIFNTFAHEILAVDTVWSWPSFTYEELKDIFKENKHGFDCKRHTLTHSVAFKEHNMANKAILIVLQNRRAVSC